MDQLPRYKLSKVEGKILTIIDASISDKRQCEAVKSLVRQEIGELYSWTTDDPPMSAARINGTLNTGPFNTDNSDIKIKTGI